MLWMLDFDCVRNMSWDSEGIRRAVRAVYQNDAYFPRPHLYGHGAGDVALWLGFKMHFADASFKCAGEKGLELVGEWVRGVEEEGRRKAAREGCWCAIGEDEGKEVEGGAALVRGCSERSRRWSDGVDCKQYYKHSAHQDHA